MTSFYVSLREGIEFSVILLLLVGVYPHHKKRLIVSALLIACGGALLTAFNFPLSGFLRKAFTGLLFPSFVLLLFLSFMSREGIIYPLIALVLTVLLPSAELTSVVLEEATLKGRWPVLSGLAGLLVAGLFFMTGLSFLKRIKMKQFFRTDGVMVFLASFCFVFGGLDEFDASSIITVLQQGLYRLLQSFVPFIEERLLIPDGKMVVTFVSEVFGYLSSQRVAMALAACILFLPPVVAFVRLLLTPEPETDAIGKRAEKRKIVAVYIDYLMKKGTPLALSLAVGIVLLHSANLAVRPTYDPEPIPVVSEGDAIAIPLKDKFGDISDGRIRKYSFLSGGKTYRFFIVMRPDGEVVAVLDACEVCPPRGYVQRGDHVVCTYCNTPMPIQTVGRPGGCNPIPVPYVVQGDTLALSKGALITAHEKQAGKETGSVLR